MKLLVTLILKSSFKVLAPVAILSSLATDVLASTMPDIRLTVQGRTGAESICLGYHGIKTQGLRNRIFILRWNNGANTYLVELVPNSTEIIGNIDSAKYDDEIRGYCEAYKKPAKKRSQLLNSQKRYNLKLCIRIHFIEVNQLKDDIKRLSKLNF